MSSRLPWKLLREAFAGEWVELVDYEWGWETPVPRWGKVRRHASDREALLERMRTEGEDKGEGPQESVILYISPVPSVVVLESSRAVV